MGTAVYFGVAVEKERNDGVPSLATIRMNGELHGDHSSSPDMDRFPPVFLFRSVKFVVVRTFVNIFSVDDERRIKRALIIEQARAA